MDGCDGELEGGVDWIEGNEVRVCVRIETERDHVRFVGEDNFGFSTGRAVGECVSGF